MELDREGLGALRGAARLRVKYEQLLRYNPRPPMPMEVERYKPAHFHRTLQAAKQSLGVGEVISDGPWINQVTPLSPLRAQTTVRARGLCV